MEVQKQGELLSQDKKIGSKPKGFKFVFVFLALIIFLLLVVFLPPLYFLARGRTHFKQATASSTDVAFKKNLKEAIRCYSQVVRVFQSRFLPRSLLSEVYYQIGLSHLYLRNHSQARPNFEQALRLFSEKATFATRSDLELKILESKVKLEGFVGNSVALVNQHIVNIGDVVDGIAVVDITGEYILFKYGDRVFSDSFDKYSPFAKRIGRGCQELFERAAKDPGGFSASFYKAAKDCARDAVLCSGMDADQTAEMKKIIELSSQKLSKIKSSIDEAKRNKEVVIGMTKTEVQEVLGMPVEKNRLFDMEFSEIWLYPDKRLYFKNEPRLQVEGILSRIEYVTSQ